MSIEDLRVQQQYVSTPDGWQLQLKRTVSPTHFDPSNAPLLIVPGYGMNSFIFGFHPRGTSMERCLAEGGYEVWSVNMRAQGDSRPTGAGAGIVSLATYAKMDVATAVDHVLHKSKTRADAVVLIGCSLGGSIVYGYLAIQPAAPVAGVIGMGAPLRWTQVPPVVKVLFSSPRLAGALRFSHTRTALRWAAPVITRVPKLLSMYMNAASIDLRRMPQMTATVEDPQPTVNREIADWVRRKDLVLDGVNTSEALARTQVPLLVILSNRDGIVPEPTALSVVDVWGGQDIEVLNVGDERDWYAHANLFVADDAPMRVFEPIIRWLRRVLE